MNDDRPHVERTRSVPQPPADEESVSAYAEGYGEGLREAFKEVLQHASRGHTAQELRFLIESRIARLSEDIELKRKSLLAPPRRPSWGSLLRAPQAQPGLGSSVSAQARLVSIEGGASYLVKEERPGRAIALIESAAEGFPRVAVVSVHPPEFPHIPSTKIGVLRLAGPGPTGKAGEGTLDPGEIGGRLREPTESSGGALVYLDALEFLVTEYGLDTTLRFVHWLVGQVQATRSALIVSLDPRALDVKELSRLQRAFNVVV